MRTILASVDERLDQRYAMFVAGMGLVGLCHAPARFELPRYIVDNDRRGHHCQDFDDHVLPLRFSSPDSASVLQFKGHDDKNKPEVFRKPYARILSPPQFSDDFVLPLVQYLT